jgi:hypothetical protein
MGFGQTGYDNIPKGGGGGDPSRVMQFFFGMDERGIAHKRRVLFLDGARALPLGFFLHNHFVRRTNTRIEEVCLVKNGLGKECPLCDHEVADKKTGEMKNWFPAYVGCFTTMILGRPARDLSNRAILLPVEHTYKNKVYKSQWDRRLLVLGRGGDKKPGALPRLVNLVADKLGVVAPDVPDLTGVVCDVYRNEGDQTDRVGDHWEVVQSGESPLIVPPDKVMSFLRSRGLAGEDLERVEKYRLWEPIDHQAYWQGRVKTPDQLRDVLARAYGEAPAQGDGKPAGGSAGTVQGEQRPLWQEGAGGGDDPPGWIPGDQIPDDDIPF